MRIIISLIILRIKTNSEVEKLSNEKSPFSSALYGDGMI